MPYLPTWLNQPDFLGAMRSGAGLGLQRREVQDRASLASESLLQNREAGINRLQLAYDQLAAEQEWRNEAIQERREQAVAKLAQELRESNALQAYRDASIGEATRHHRAVEARPTSGTNWNDLTQSIPGFMEDYQTTGDFTEAARLHPEILRVPGITQLFTQQEIGKRAESNAASLLNRFQLTSIDREISALERQKTNPMLALAGDTPATVQKAIDELKEQRQQLLETVTSKSPNALQRATAPSPAEGTVLRYDSKGNRVK